jgi:hypothetical protein
VPAGGAPPTGLSCPAAQAVHQCKLAEVDGWIGRLPAVREEITAQIEPRCAFDRPTEEPT